MQKLTLLFLLFSCGLIIQTSNVRAQENKFKLQNSYFQNDTLVYSYNTKIKLFSNTTSGVLLLKKQDDSYRVVLSTPFGNTLMDGTFSNDRFQFTYVVADLNKKVITRTLALDFEILLLKTQKSTKINDNDSVFVENMDFEKHLLKRSFSKDHYQLNAIQCFQKKKKKIEFQFLAKKPTFVDKIIIQHYTLPLTIELLAIENN